MQPQLIYFDGADNWSKPIDQDNNEKIVILGGIVGWN